MNMKKEDPLSPEDELLRGIVRDYHEARAPVLRHTKLTRGTGRIVAALAEERLAHYLVAKFPDVSRIYIDQQLTFDKESPITKPDLIVCRGAAIKLLIDVKMDLGYMRDRLPDFVTTASSFMESLKGKSGRVSVRRADLTSEEKARVSPDLLEPKRGVNKVPRVEVPVTLSSTARYAFVVISGTNISVRMKAKAVAGAKEYPHIPVFQLFPEAHPNDQTFTDYEAAWADLGGLADRKALLQLTDTLAEVLRLPDDAGN
jgi:hypothetical protein